MTSLVTFPDPLIPLTSTEATLAAVGGKGLTSSAWPTLGSPSQMDS